MLKTSILDTSVQIANSGLVPHFPGIGEVRKPHRAKTKPNCDIIIDMHWNHKYPDNSTQ